MLLSLLTIILHSALVNKTVITGKCIFHMMHCFSLWQTFKIKPLHLSCGASAICEGDTHLAQNRQLLNLSQVNLVQLKITMKVLLKWIKKYILSTIDVFINSCIFFISEKRRYKHSIHYLGSSNNTSQNYCSVLPPGWKWVHLSNTTNLTCKPKLISGCRYYWKKVPFLNILHKTPIIFLKAGMFGINLHRDI